MKSEQEHILYLDDEVDNLTVFRATFRADYTIHTVRSVEEGIEIIKKEPIKVVITDHRISQTTGIDFLVRVASINPDIVSIVLTGYSDAHDIIMTINKVNVYKYLTKPWTKEEVGIAIEESLEVYQLKKERKELVADLEKRNRELLVEAEKLSK